MKKKLLAAILCMSMVMGSTMMLGATEITENAGTYSHEFSSESDVNSPVVKVTVPSTAVKFIINPYQLEYEDASNNKHTDKVIFEAQDISSKSNVPLAVTLDAMIAKDESTSNVVISAVPITEKITTKSIYLYMAIAEAAASAADYTADTVKKVPFTTKNVVTKTGITIPASDGTDAETISFKIMGDMVSVPTTTPWGDADTVTTTYKFTFNPEIVTP